MPILRISLVSRLVQVKKVHGSLLGGKRKGNWRLTPRTPEKEALPVAVIL
jgi:hypothetical protein